MAEAQLVGFAAVVTANAFNPSIIREHWLMSRHLLAEGDMQPGFLFTDQAVRIPTARFQLLVLPPQLQFAPLTPDVAADAVNDFLSPLIRALPETPFAAVGLNFVWHIDTAPEQVSQATRRLFLSGAHPLAGEFAEGDAHFGAYMSKDVDGARLKLDIKPITVTVNEQKTQFVQCSFNFNRDVAGANAADDICTVLARWGQYETMSARLANLVAGAA